MHRKSIDISGEGDHVIIPASPGRTIVDRIILTFSHSAGQSLMVRFKSGGATIAGPFYVMDGGDIDYKRAPDERHIVSRGDDFIIELADGLSAAGMIEYSLGSW